MINSPVAAGPSVSPFSYFRRMCIITRNKEHISPQRGFQGTAEQSCNYINKCPFRHKMKPAEKAEIALSAGFCYIFVRVIQMAPVYTDTITIGEFNHIRASVGFEQIHPEQVKAEMDCSIFIAAARTRENCWHGPFIMEWRHQCVNFCACHSGFIILTH